MEILPLNGQSIRCVRQDEKVWLLSCDANQVLGFDGKNSPVNQQSIPIQSIFPDIQLHPESLVILLSDFVKLVLRSDNPAHEQLQDEMYMFANNEFKRLLLAGQNPFESFSLEA